MKLLYFHLLVSISMQAMDSVLVNAEQTMNEGFYNQINDEELRNYCNENRELSPACVEYARLIRIVQNTSRKEGIDAFKEQRKISKEFTKIIEAINKEMHKKDKAHTKELQKEKIANAIKNMQ